MTRSAACNLLLSNFLPLYQLMNKLILYKISVVGFKNYSQLNLHFSEKFNCIVGDNGGGKTNLLDAIYYLSFTKSYFNLIDLQNIHPDSNLFLIQGGFKQGENEDEVYCAQVKGERKQVKVNKNEVARFADHVGNFPVVMSSPSDIELIFDGSETRRKFIDSIIAQYDRQYLEDIITYTKALQQRNAQLKNFSKTGFDADVLGIWNRQLVESGNRIYEKRKKISLELLPVFQKYYSAISADKERVGLTYKSQLDKGDFEALLNESIDKDRVMEYTTVGIHKDDWEFKMNDYPIKKVASQGQQKSYLLSVKLSQYEFIRLQKRVKPILMLDDIYDKLDENRLKRLIDVLSTDEFGQVFITDTNEDRIKTLFKGIKSEMKIFNVRDGEIAQS